MAKRYIKIGFEDRPSTKSPIDSKNLNLMDDAIDELDSWRDGLIVDNLASVLTNKALSANQGKLLNDKVTTLNESLGFPFPRQVTDLNAVPMNVRSTVYIQWGEHSSKPNNHNLIMETYPIAVGTVALQVVYDYDSAINDEPMVYTRHNYGTSGTNWKLRDDFYRTYNSILVDANFAVRPGTYTFDPTTVNAEGGYGIVSVEVGLSGMWIFQTKRNTDGTIRYREKINDAAWTPWRNNLT